MAFVVVVDHDRIREARRIALVGGALCYEADVFVVVLGGQRWWPEW